MTVINMKVTRQKLLQTAILDKVEREHLPSTPSAFAAVFRVSVSM